MTEEKYRYIDPGNIINLTLYLTIEKENRYIIDSDDIARFLETFKTNLEKQNISVVFTGERISRNRLYSNCIQKFCDKNDSIYFMLLPWFDLKDFCHDIVGGITATVIKACYQDNLYQNLPPRSDEDLEKLNEIYLTFLNQIEEENTQQYEFYGNRIKKIIKQRQRINSNKH